MRSAIISAVFCCAPVISFALTCPTASQIQNKQIAPWVALDTNTDSPVDAETFKQFQKEVQTFYRAEWLPGVPYASQCYYQLKEAPYYSEVSLGNTQDKEPFGENWHFFNKDYSRKTCESTNVLDCIFRALVNDPEHLKSK